ncbi:MAG: type II toxin-antitoxin system VapC family toxin [Micrococcales bacterium]|nr:type II toxin-antitoxin system VapC family toxin [Micrococcales bacterium]
MILLDTNAVIRVFTGSPGLGAEAREAIASDHAHFSAVSVTEIVIKAMLGRVPGWPSLPDWLVRSGLHELPLKARHAQAIESFPALTRHDPFDRMLLGQAKAEGMRLLTSDRVLLALGLDWIVDTRT